MVSVPVATVAMELLEPVGREAFEFGAIAGNSGNLQKAVKPVSWDGLDQEKNEPKDWSNQIEPGATEGAEDGGWQVWKGSTGGVAEDGC